MPVRGAGRLILALCALLPVGCASVRGTSTLLQTGRPPAAASPSAQQDHPSIQPDRPDQTNAAYTVPKGLVQIETGVQRSRVQQAGESVATPATVRVGLAHWFEARVDSDGVTRNRSGEETNTEFGGLTAGGKIRLWAPASGATAVTLQPGVTFPWGRTGGGTDFLLRVITGADLPAHLHLDVNYGIGAIAAESAHVAQHLASASANVSIRDRWNPYAEAYWLSRESDDPHSKTRMDTGLIYYVKPRLAIDGGVVFGLSAFANDRAVFGGLSVIVGEFMGHRGIYSRLREAQLRGDR